MRVTPLYRDGDSVELDCCPSVRSSGLETGRQGTLATHWGGRRGGHRVHKGDSNRTRDEEVVTEIESIQNELLVGNSR